MCFGERRIIIWRVGGRKKTWTSLRSLGPIILLPQQQLDLRNANGSAGCRVCSCSVNESCLKEPPARIGAPRWEAALLEIEEQLSQLGWTIHI